MTSAMLELADREAFIEAHRYLDLTERNDAWGRPMFSHTHIQAMWDGWKEGRTALRASAPGAAVAVREALRTEIDRWEKDERTLYPDNEVLESLDRIATAIAPAAVGMDAREAFDEIERLRNGIKAIVDLKNPMPRAAVREACAELLAATPLCAVTRPERA